MKIDNNGNKWYKIGLHIHTTISDGKKTPEECAKIYKDAGFDAIAITDHWKFHGEDNICGLKIISGCEYNLGASNTINGGVMHIVGVGMKTDPNIVRETASPQSVIDAINNNNGLSILAHPHWSLNTVNDVKDLKGFGATEIYNSVSDANQSSRPYSGYFIDALANYGIVYKLLATDDVHYYDGSDETKSFIMVKAKSLETEDILSAIENEDYYSSQGPELYIEKFDDKLVVDCSKCSKIMFLSNASWARDKITRGTDLTHAEYPFKEFEKWVRVEVVDEDGNYAWSNIIKLK